MSHYIPFFIGDYDRDTKDLTMIEHGAYFALLRHVWATGQPLPLDETLIFRIASAFTDQEQDAIRKILAKFFTKKSTGFFNKKALEIFKKQAEKIETLRKNGSRGGIRKKANAIANATNLLEQNSSKWPSIPEPEPNPDPELKPDPDSADQILTSSIMIAPSGAEEGGLENFSRGFRNAVCSAVEYTVTHRNPYLKDGSQVPALVQSLLCTAKAANPALEPVVLHKIWQDIWDSGLKNKARSLKWYRIAFASEMEAIRHAR